MLKKYVAILTVALALGLPALLEGCTGAQKQDAKTALTWTQTFCLAQNPDKEPLALALFCGIDEAAVPSIVQWLSVYRGQVAAARASASASASIALLPADAHLGAPALPPVAVIASHSVVAVPPPPAVSSAPLLAPAPSAAPKKGRAAK